MNLQQDDLNLLELLTWKVRLASATQMESLREGMRARIDRLSAAGFVKSATMVVAVSRVVEPLCQWRPGENAPNFAALSYRMTIRREQAEQTNERVCWASTRAVQIVGGVGGRLRQRFQLEHDLGVTQTYLARCARDHASKLSWLGEDCFRKLFSPRGKVPDAVLCDPLWNIEMAIEYGGLYPAEYLHRFHQHCVRKRLPYEIW